VKSLDPMSTAATILPRVLTTSLKSVDSVRRKPYCFDIGRLFHFGIAGVL